jgi:hypothetical protein
MSVELIYGLMAALPLLPFAIASRRAGWLGVAGGIVWLMWCSQGVLWPNAGEEAVIQEMGVASELLVGLLYAGPMLCVGLYGLASNAVARDESRAVSATAHA